MTYAQEISSVFGPFLVISGLWVVICVKRVISLWGSFKTNAPIFYTAGMLNLLLGIYIITMYNIWIGNLTIFVTLLGWVLAIRGGLLLFFPRIMFQLFLSTKNIICLWGIISIVWGAIFVKIAYF